MVTPATPRSTPPTTVHSVRRAANALHVVAAAPTSGCSLAQIARAIGVTRSSALALCRTLVDEGLLRTSQPGPRYHLGTALVRLGARAAEAGPLARLARPHLESLARETGLLARLCVRERGEIATLLSVEPAGPHLAIAPGTLEPVERCAAGWVLLAAGEVPEPAPPHDGLVAIGRDGFVTEDGRAHRGVVSIAAAVEHHLGERPAALVISGVGAAIGSRRERRRLGELVRAQARALAFATHGERD